MELKDFIRDTLVEIAIGVQEAQEPVQQAGGLAVPTKTDPSMTVYAKQAVTPFQLVEFDVVLTSGETKAGKAGIGVFFASVGVGGQKKSETTAGSQTRVKFAVPLKLPCGD